MRDGGGTDHNHVGRGAMKSAIDLPGALSSTERSEVELIVTLYWRNVQSYHQSHCATMRVVGMALNRRVLKVGIDERPRWGFRNAVAIFALQIRHGFIRRQ